MRCSICNSDNSFYKFNIGTYKLFKCNSCTVEFLHPQPSDDELTALYSKEYYNSWGVQSQGPDVAKMMKYKNGLNILDKIIKYKSQGCLLDVGCAFGFFLEAARDRGFKVKGVEYSEYSSNQAKKKLGNANIHTGTIESCNFPKNSFDVITMFDLIEHTKNPLQTLRKAAEFLSGDGIIVISTPNTSSMLNNIMGKSWLHYKEEHLYYFNDKSIKTIAESTGLKVLKVQKLKKTFYPQYVFHQFEVYPKKIVTPAMRGLKSMLPSKLNQLEINVGIGEIFIILGRK